MNSILDQEAREKIKLLQIESSYSENDLGIFLYESILNISPKRVVEFGTLYGYSAICMGLALKTLGSGKLVCYDLWEEYPYKNSKKEDVQGRISEFGLSDFVSLEKGDVFADDWSSLEFDLCHIDISNDGEKILGISRVFSHKISQGIPVIFEGGTEERDQYDWMIKYQKTPIRSVKDRTDFVVINDKFPGISVFGKSIAENHFKINQRD